MAVNGNGATPTEHYRNEEPVPAEPLPPGMTVIIEDDDGSGDQPGIELQDGSLLIRLDGKMPTKKSADRYKHDANLAEYIDEHELGRISDELLNGINADIQSRQEWLDRRAAGIKHLALKVENPRSPSADADTAVEGQSTIRSPILLDAVMRHQANARGELLPAGGPVKIQNDHIDLTQQTFQAMTAQAGGQPPPPSDDDQQAEVLERLFNRYLTVVDKEYYPDTTRMFFMQGFGGCGFKKVYVDPVRRRPVSRSIDAKDIIVSDGEVSLQDCGRVTHRIEMRQSVMKRMQLGGIYRDVDVMTPMAPDPDAAERAEKDVAGFAVWGTRPEDYEHTVYECYCELDIAGFEHEDKGKPTGLPLPYRVSIDKDSQEILEIRRNWREGDDRYLKRMPIVKYPFVEGMGFYGIGLLAIMGNATAAVTTSWRLALDSAGFSSWPGFLYSETVGRQDTMLFRVGLGAGMRINTAGMPIGQHVMPLPYKDVTAGLVQVTGHIEDEARRVGGTPEMMVGEGRQDVPVGTTLAMLDQAAKVIDSVHKGMHIAQAEELSLLRDLFIEDPGALLCDAASSQWQWEKADLVSALQNCNLAPKADPNTPSHTIRVMKAVALLQLVMLNPQDWDTKAVAMRVAQMAGLGRVDDLMAQQPAQDPNQPMDPDHLAKLGQLQLKAQELAQKTQDSQQKQAMDYMSNQLKLMQQNMQLQNNREQRMSQERQTAAKLANERMQMAESAMIHPEAAPAARQFVQTWPQGMINGGRVW